MGAKRRAMLKVMGRHHQKVITFLKTKPVEQSVDQQDTNKGAADEMNVGRLNIPDTRTAILGRVRRGCPSRRKGV